MGDDKTVIVRMSWIVLVDNAHDPSNELDIRRQAAEWAENSSYAQLTMIETLTQHLHLNDAIDTATVQLSEDFVPFVGLHLAVDLSCLDAKLLVN